MMHSPKVNRSFLLTLTYPSLCVRFEKVAFKGYPKQCNATLNENLATEISSIWTSSRGYQLQVCLWVFWVFFFFSFFFTTYLFDLSTTLQRQSSQCSYFQRHNHNRRCLNVLGQECFKTFGSSSCISSPDLTWSFKKEFQIC